MGEAEEVTGLRDRYMNDLHIDDSGSIFNTDAMEAWELGCLLDLAIITAESALQRTESRGGHSREDYKERDDENWMVHTLACSETGDPYPKAAHKLKLNTKKQVNRSLEAVDKRFAPKERVY